MHACHGHRCQPLPVPLSGTGKKKGVGIRGGLPALADTREYKQAEGCVCRLVYMDVYMYTVCVYSVCVFNVFVCVIALACEMFILLNIFHTLIHVSLFLISVVSFFLLQMIIVDNIFLIF